MKVTACNGSLRKEGNTSLLIGQALETLKKEGIETESVQVGGEKLHGCIACYQCFARKDARCAVADDIANSCIEKMLNPTGLSSAHQHTLPRLLRTLRTRTERPVRQ